jgi:hypothetical protein
LALWGLARTAILHQIPEAYEGVREGLDDRNGEVRLTTADLILDVYLRPGQEIPEEVIQKLQEMAEHDPDPDVRQGIERFLRRLRAD